MVEVLRQAAVALSTNDPDTLERLETELGLGGYAIGNLAETRRAASVLSAQVSATAANLSLFFRAHSATETYKALPWER